jgi:uncharacterized protein YjiS (DUF1127 family)
MEMHTSKSLFAVHGIVVQPRPRVWPRRFKSLLGLLSRMSWALKRELQFRRAVAHLEDMDDHMLDDLGIERNDIEHVVRGGRVPGMAKGQRTGDAGR